MYKLRYYKDIESRGHLWRLEFLHDTEDEVTPMEIGPVLQSLRLVLQGEQADIDTPIVKTSLEMSFIDAPDLETDRKCGYWEEFYTSSSTEYMVCLYKDGVKEWSGYITPDSFAEDLRHRGSVSLIARDNLGTLQDIDCDAYDTRNTDGKVRVSDVIVQAIKKSNCALEINMGTYDADLTLPYSYERAGRIETAGAAAHQLLDSNALAELNWAEALEQTLYAVGAVIRYVGGNCLKVIPIRDIPKCGHAEWWDVPIREVRFLSYGRRELAPGAKDITETHKFYISTDGIEQKSIEMTNFQDTIMQGMVWLKHKDSDQNLNNYIPTWEYINRGNNTTILASQSPLLNITKYQRIKGEDSEAYGAWDDKGILYYAINAAEPEDPTFTRDYPVRIMRRVFTASGKAAVRFTLDKTVSLTLDETGVLNTPITGADAYGTNPYVEFYIKLEHGNSNQVSYYNPSSKTWSTSPYRCRTVLRASLFTLDVPQPAPVEVTDIPIPDIGVISVDILVIRSAQLELRVRRPVKGMYMRIRDILIDLELPDEYSMLKRLTLTTVNSEKYAVRISRSPQFFINETTMPEVAYMPQALLFEERHNTYMGVGDWSWYGKGARGEGISLARLIHQQLLMFHGKPTNVLTGDLVISDNIGLNFGGVWVWNNTPHVLISGTLNILTGHIEGATLREYTRYEHIWETYCNKDELIADYGESMGIFIATSLGGKELTQNDVTGLPGWISIRHIKSSSGGRYTFAIDIMANASGEERSAILVIDKTARLKITQRAAGDYGLDYGMDYA